MNKPLADLVTNKLVTPAENPILQGNFAPVDQEQDRESLVVHGEIPASLNGTLLRNGPNPVQPGDNHHWFTGDAMLHAIRLANGSAELYSNRWVRTKALEEKNGLEATPVNTVDLPIQGSGNVNVVQHGGRILALPEIGLPFEMTNSLETVGLFDYEGKLNSSMTAHPKIDRKTGEMFFFGYDIAPPYLRYHVANAEGKLIRNVDIELPSCVMMHDFGVTATRVVFMDLPIVGDFELLEAGFNMPFRWSDQHQARLGIMNREATSDEVQWIDIDPCYVFHPLNTFDDGDNIIMDVVRYEKAFNDVDDNDFDKHAKLVRWTINPTAGTVESKVINSEGQEFPRVNPNVECYPHRYGYSLQVRGEHGFKNLIKYDLEQGTEQYYEVGTNKAGGEPVFVPTGDGEDEGFVLSVVYNGESKLSELHIINAQAFDQGPVAVVELGARVPFGFHGNFVTN